MKPNVDSMVAIMRGFQSGREVLEKLRKKEIRESDILVDGPKLDGLLDSAKFIGFSKPMTGLVEFRRLLTEMNKC